MAGPVRTRRPSVKKIVVGGNFFPPASSIPIEPQKMKRLTACLKECCMMKRTLSALMLSGALLCALSVPALAAEPAAPKLVRPSLRRRPFRTACCTTAL